MFLGVHHPKNGEHVFIHVFYLIQNMDFKIKVMFVSFSKYENMNPNGAEYCFECELDVES